VSKKIIVGAFAVIIAALFWWFFISTRTPTGQRPLIVLERAEDLDQVKSLFNANKDKTRVIALLSPT
jgi:hypothetical protein